MRGKFITFEGPEGGGKSTQVNKLVEWLRLRGLEVIQTREPGGTILSERIRGLLQGEEADEDPPVSRAEVLLFLAARAQLVTNVIKPALERGAWVVSDRFMDSTFAYQGYGRGIDVNCLKSLNAFATENLVPDKTFLLDLPVTQGLKRAAERANLVHIKADRFERTDLSFHEKLREGFLVMAQAEPQRLVIVDALQDKVTVSEQILKVITAEFTLV